ncbi:MAG: helix-turn-helix domain-containing protein [Bacillota bacterium]
MNKVRVPVSLLLDPMLTVSAKVIWIVLRLYPELTRGSRPSPTRLAALTGLSPPTVRKGLARLSAAGWYTPQPEHRESFGVTQEAAQSRSQGSRASTPQIHDSPHTRERHAYYGSSTKIHTHRLVRRAQRWSRRYVTIPRELIEDRFIKPQAVVIYGVLQATPGFWFPNGKYTCKQLRELTGRALSTIRRAVNALVQRGWLQVSRKNHLCPFAFTIKNPVSERCKAELARVAKQIDRAKFKGEELMKQYLSLIVDSDEFEDNASPGFLVNPFTDERMELDRYYPGRAAFEFNGPQHYQATEFSAPEEVERQKARDYIKAGICADRGIKLIVVHPEDLSLKTMIEKVGTCLPLRDLRNREHIVRYLERVSSRYRQAALESQASQASNIINGFKHKRFYAIRSVLHDSLGIAPGGLGFPET